MIDAPFSSDYAAARARFRAAAEAAGFSLVAEPIDQEGPTGESLTIDFAYRGPKRPSRAIVLSSGTHGVEGYFGSAIQIALLEKSTRWGRLHPESRMRFTGQDEDVGILMVHALNPYGFAWVRRVNEDNVDLNRNFLSEGEPYSGAPDGYRDLDSLLNPPSAPRLLDPFYPQAGAKLAKYGMPALKSAIAVGQYEYPEGLFFGGKGPAKVQSLLRKRMPELLGSPERVIHLDWHTGLGRWGEYALCVDLPRDNRRTQQLIREFGDDNVQAFDTEGVLYAIRGGLGTWLDRLFSSTQYDTMLAEFGTIPSGRVLAALREENRAHRYLPAHTPAWRAAKRKLKEAFVPESRKWQALVVDRGVLITERAMAAMRSDVNQVTKHTQEVAQTSH